MTMLNLIVARRQLLLSGACAAVAFVYSSCRMQDVKPSSGAMPVEAPASPVPLIRGCKADSALGRLLASIPKEPGEGEAVELSDGQMAARDAELRSVLMALPPYELHEGSVEEFRRDVDAGVVRFRRDGAPWLDWPGDGSRPEFRALLENGGKRLRVLFFYQGLENVFGTGEQVYEWKSGAWKPVSYVDRTYTVPDGKIPGDEADKVQGRLSVVGPHPYSCLLQGETGDRYLDWNSVFLSGVLEKMRRPDGSYAPAWVHVQVKPVGLSSSAGWRIVKAYGCSTEKDRPRWFR